MSSLVQKAPNLKILNLSGNEVRPEGLVVLWAGRAEGAEGLPADGGRLGEGVSGMGVSLALLTRVSCPLFLCPPPTLQLKSERELDKVKGLKLEELWLDGNPLCDTFRDQSTYIRSVVASVSPPGDLHPPGG